MIKRLMFFDEPQLGAAEDGQRRVIEIAAFPAKLSQAPAAPLQWWARKAGVATRRQSPLTTAAVIRWPGGWKLNTPSAD